MSKYYQFEFTGPAESSAVATTPQSPVQTTPEALGADQAGFQGFGARAAKSAVSQAIISPLNSATGGLAAPAYQLGRSLASGAGAAAVGGAVAGLAVAGVMLAIRAVGERLDKVESEARQANEREVLLLRAGAIRQVSTYEGNFFSGVQKVNRG